MRNLPIETGIVWIVAITIAVIGRSDICSDNSKYPAIPTKK